MEVKINITLENKISHHYQQQIPLTNTWSTKEIRVT
jgi:hypothetical protein